jgi:hypothetical protein
MTRLSQMSEIQVGAGSLCGKAAVLRDRIKRTHHMQIHASFSFASPSEQQPDSFNFNQMSSYTSSNVSV